MQSVTRHADPAVESCDGSSVAIEHFDLKAGQRFSVRQADAAETRVSIAERRRRIQ
jgi:hypothetical protein